MVSENISSCGTRALVRRLRRTRMASWSTARAARAAWWQGRSCRGSCGGEMEEHVVEAGRRDVECGDRVDGQVADQCRRRGRVGQRERHLGAAIADRRRRIGPPGERVEAEGGMVAARPCRPRGTSARPGCRGRDAAVVEDHHLVGEPVGLLQVLVVSSTVVPVAVSSATTSHNAFRAVGSRPVVGSSRNSTVGEPTRLAARSTRRASHLTAHRPAGARCCPGLSGREGRVARPRAAVRSPARRPTSSRFSAVVRKSSSRRTGR